MTTSWTNVTYSTTDWVADDQNIVYWGATSDIIFGDDEGLLIFERNYSLTPWTDETYASTSWSNVSDPSTSWSNETYATTNWTNEVDP